MKKLTHLDKQILITNQRLFELEEPNRKKAHFLYFRLTKLNKFAKKYNIDLYAVPKSEIKTYTYKYVKDGKEQEYPPMFRCSTELWSKENNIFKRLRESMPNKKIIFFIVLPYYDGGKIQRMNFYKEIGPCTYYDFVIMAK